MPASQKPPVYYHISLCILAFALPFPFIYSSVSIALVSLAWLGQFSLVKTKQRFLERRALLGWFLFFALLVLSFFISADKEEARIDLQKKLSLIILPVVIGLGPQLDRRWLNRIFTSFVVGLCLIGLFCMGRGLLFFVQSGDTEMLFYHSLVRGLDINAVYYSSYLIFALSILLLHHFEHSVFRDTRLKYVALAILMVFFTLLSSKSLLVLFIVFVLPIAFYQKQKKGLINKRQVLAIAGLVALAIIYVAVSDNPIKKRYLEITTNNEIVAESEASKGKEQVFNNLSLRLFLWKMAWNNINEQNLWITGCGIGDIGTLQKQRIEQYEEQTQALQNQPDLSILNLHNMYLQVLMGMGIAGLVVFLTMVFRPLLYLKRISSGYEFLVFIVSYSLYMMQESALQTQAGVIYFSFFYQLLIVNYYSEKSRQLKTAGG